MGFIGPGNKLRMIDHANIEGMLRHLKGFRIISIRTEAGKDKALCSQAVNILRINLVPIIMALVNLGAAVNLCQMAILEIHVKATVAGMLAAVIYGRYAIGRDAHHRRITVMINFRRIGAG